MNVAMVPTLYQVLDILRVITWLVINSKLLLCNRRFFRVILCNSNIKLLLLKIAESYEHVNGRGNLLHVVGL